MLLTSAAELISSKPHLYDGMHLKSTLTLAKSNFET